MFAFGRHGCKEVGTSQRPADTWAAPLAAVARKRAVIGPLIGATTTTGGAEMMRVACKTAADTTIAGAAVADTTIAKAEVAVAVMIGALTTIGGAGMMRVACKTTADTTIAKAEVHRF